MLKRFVLLLGLLWPGAAAAQDFDYYVLALSWSPAYCLLHEGDRDQCTKGYGFVLHGLWPQYERGGYPEHCESAQAMSGSAQKLGAMTYPSPFLAIHEWNEHGRCTGLSALDYFRAAEKSFTGVTIPQEFDAPEKPMRLSTGQLLDVFRSANPKWPENSIVAICQGDALSEMRFCLGKDLSPRACGRQVRNHCPGQIGVDPIR